MVALWLTNVSILAERQLRDLATSRDVNGNDDDWHINDDLEAGERQGVVPCGAKRDRPRVRRPGRECISASASCTRRIVSAPSQTHPAQRTDAGVERGGRCHARGADGAEEVKARDPCHANACQIVLIGSDDELGEYFKGVEQPVIDMKGGEASAPCS